MGEPTFSFRADDYMLVSTKGSKYAHSANWTARSWTSHSRAAACGVKLPTFDEFDIDHMTQKFVYGKPPCPKCISRLKFEAKWLLYYAEVYAGMVVALEEEDE